MKLGEADERQKGFNGGLLHKSVTRGQHHMSKLTKTDFQLCVNNSLDIKVSFYLILCRDRNMVSLLSPAAYFPVSSTH